MDTTQVAQNPIATAMQPNAVDQQQPPTGPSGEIQAPPLAPVEQQPQAAPPAEEPFQFTRAQYEAMQAQLEEANRKASVLDQVEQVAAQQRERREAEQYNQQLKAKVAEAFKRATDMPDDDRAVEELYNFINQNNQQITQTYQQEIDTYAQTVQQAMWEAQKPALADQFMQQYGLPPSARDTLLQFNDDHTMKAFAEQTQRVYTDAQAMFNQNAAQNQVNQLRQNGTFAVAGEGGSPPPRPIEAGSVQELMPVMRRIFGMGQN